MTRFATTLPTVALLASLILATSGQALTAQPVALEAQSAARALDAVPAVFAVAQNLEGVEIDVSTESMVSGFGDLAGRAEAQDQLTAALGAYGFGSYGAWAATIRTIFATHGFVRSKGQAAPVVDRALQRVLNDPGVPQSQRDAIVGLMEDFKGSGSTPNETEPAEENLAVVIRLAPQIESTIEMIRAMQ